MKRLVAFVAGSLFGIGLFLSGMTDTSKVQGWLDLFGNWDPTLAFVMGGAMIPMFIAWKFTEGRKPIYAENFPARNQSKVDRDLILGSVLFGVGWGLAGLCPGPAIASLGFGGAQSALFVLSMLVGMWLTPSIRFRISNSLAT
ncbi:MAG: hypothetical protein EBW42_08190 [Rhodobacterales bacterium]|jgi:uncharacterized membrane protein YedE/YeeE|nr:hypothetical protein [Rhodobacterales bacterium]